MAIGYILRRSLNALLYSLWWVVLKYFDKLHPLKRRFHLDPQGNLEKQSQLHLIKVIKGSLKELGLHM